MGAHTYVCESVHVSVVCFSRRMCEIVPIVASVDAHCWRYTNAGQLSGATIT